jgi:hypothetical protein
MRLFGAIEKFDKREDGTLVVSGIASSEALDSDGQTITADAMTQALPDYMRFGAVREMHKGDSAAGTCLSADVTPDGKTRVTTLIVDPLAVKKVTTGVYKGFSIGGEALSVQGKAITRLRLKEISLVDRPANPESVFDLWKADKAVKPSMDYKQFAKALGLADTATEAEILAAISKKPEAPVLPDIAGEITKAIKAAGIDALDARFKALDEKIEAGNKEAIAKADKAERVALVEQAGREGKVIPLTDDTIFGNAEKKVEAISLPALKEIVAKAQKSVAVIAKAPKQVKDGDRTLDVETLRQTGFEKPEDRLTITKAAKARAVGIWDEYFTKNGLQPQN